MIAGLKLDGLELDGLAVARGGRTLFEGLNLRLAAGGACALTGPNGAGKTSLLRTVAGLTRPEAGDVRFGEMDPGLARGAHLHFVGHQDALKTGRTAGEELAFWARWCGAASDGVAQAARALELDRLLDLEIRRLSAGQRRRVALARLLAAPRSLWLLDEPLTPLDARWRAAVGEMMAAHLAKGGMILAAVHDPLPVATRALELTG